MSPFKAVTSFQQHIKVLSSVSEMERGSSEPPVARNTGSGRSTSTAPMSIPRSASMSCHPHPGSKKHKRTPLYQRSVRGHVRWCPHWLDSSELLLCHVTSNSMVCCVKKDLNQDVMRIWNSSFCRCSSIINGCWQREVTCFLNNCLSNQNCMGVLESFAFSAWQLEIGKHDSVVVQLVVSCVFSSQWYKLSGNSFEAISTWSFSTADQMAPQDSDVALLLLYYPPHYLWSFLYLHVWSVFFFF